MAIGRIAFILTVRYFTAQKRNRIPDADKTFYKLPLFFLGEHNEAYRTTYVTSTELER